MGWPGSRAKLEFNSCAGRGVVARDNVEKTTIEISLIETSSIRAGLIGASLERVILPRFWIHGPRRRPWQEMDWPIKSTSGGRSSSPLRLRFLTKTGADCTPVGLRDGIGGSSKQ